VTLADEPMVPAAATAGPTAPRDAVLGQLLLAFEGRQLPPDMAGRLGEQPAAGITLFRTLNVTDAAQLRALTDAVQALAPPGLPFVVAIDHEGGQLIGLGSDATPFAGNMALGAAGDPALTRRVAAAIGRELRAVGVNVNYAPVADLATQPANPGLGVRCFGDAPGEVAAHVAATVLGLADSGMASALKHFPGGGEATGDPHHLLPVISAERARFEAVELLPFVAGIQAGARLVMTGHPAVPGLTGDPALPATVARAVVNDLLRGELGFDGATVSDALDMAALPQGPEQAVDTIAAIAAGQDLLLLTADTAATRRIEAAVLHAAARGLLPAARLAEAAARVGQLRRALAAADGDPGIVGCGEHRALADELARRAVTLLRDEASLLPLRPAPDQRIGVLMPRPANRTPADTSAQVAPGLADAVRRRHPRVDEWLVAQAPDDDEIAAAVAWARGQDILLLGSIDASFEPRQAALVRALLATGRPAVTVALRTPWDLGAYPQARTHACTYSILGPSLDALVAALWGEAAFPGRLPVAGPESR
jgi:beta-N-acetylhexosaminidase